MKGIERTLILFICFTLALALASCAQGQVNKNRLPGGASEGPAGGTEGSSGSTQDSHNDGSFEIDTFVDVENNTFEDTRRWEGGGTILYTVTSAKLYDSLADAGISEESYAASGMSKCDYYVKVDMTVKNVDVSDTGHEYNANNFKLMGRVSFDYKDPVWFSLGGLANSQKSAYFHYCVPPAGETMEISLAFGLSDSELAAFRESGGVWLAYMLTAPRLQRMKLENVI